MKNYKKIAGLKSDLWQSQNYLHNTNLVIDLLEKSNICMDDTVIEIGPGKGVITWQLVRKCRKVYGIEYDFYLYEKLKNKFNHIENIDIIYGDFLKYELPCDAPYKVFSNISFNITAGILNKLLFCTNPPQDTYLIMQREAAVKYAGNPYGCECMRSLLLKPFFETDMIHHFKNTDFYPVPNVSTVLLHIKKRKSQLVDNRQINEYYDFIAYVFSTHGKSLKERLARVFTTEQYKRLAYEAEFDSACGPLDLNFAQWLLLFRYYAGYISEEKKRSVLGTYSRLVEQQNKLNKIHRNTIRVSR